MILDQLEVYPDKFWSYARNKNIFCGVNIKLDFSFDYFMGPRGYGLEYLDAY